MLLYRYFGSHAFETLKDAKLKTSRFSTFNDPFEFLYVPVGKLTPKKARAYLTSKINSNSPTFFEQFRREFPDARNAKELGKAIQKNLPQFVIKLVKDFENIKKQFIENHERRSDKNMRVVCFCNADKVSQLDEILMWSHYAQKHNGVRIGFEFPKGIIHPFEIVEVKYQDKRVVVDISAGLDGVAEQNAINQSTRIKSTAWKYEQEFRLFTNRAQCEARTMRDSSVEHFLPFNREWVKSIDFGVRCTPAEIQQLVDLLKNDYPNVIRRKAVFHETEYALEYKVI